MKCARCGHDSTYPQRSGGVCPGCKGRFAFEPRTGDPLPDMAWKSAIDQVSSQGTVRFTASHLHHAVARRVKRPSRSFVGLLVAGVIASAIGGGTGVAALFFVGAAMVAIGIGIAMARPTSGPKLEMERAQFQALFERWCAAHGKPKGLIAPRAAARPMSEAMRRELESYSFDRAVICDTPDTVDVLLGNDFHFENNCAVLTAGGYPEHAAPTIMTMLKQNPRLEVFVLHDATVEGCVLAHMLRNDPKWFGGSTARVFDVALRPAQASRVVGLHWQAPRRVDPHPALTESEVAWLSKRWMSLAVITPEQLVKRLFRAMQHLPEQADKASSDTSSSGSSSSDVILWTSDAHTSDGGGDSFG